MRLRKKCPDIRTAISGSAYARPENELLSAREAVFHLANVHAEAMSQDAAKQATLESRHLRFKSSHLLKSFHDKQGKVPRLNLLDILQGEAGGSGGERALTEPYRQMASSLRQVLSSRYPPAAPTAFRLLRGRSVAEPLKPLAPFSASSCGPSAASRRTQAEARGGGEAGGGNGAAVWGWGGAEETVVVVRGVQDSPERSIEDSLRYILRGYPVQLLAVYERPDAPAHVTIRFPAPAPAISAAELGRELGLECEVWSAEASAALHAAADWKPEQEQEQEQEEQGVPSTATCLRPFPDAGRRWAEAEAGAIGAIGAKEEPRALPLAFPSPRRLPTRKVGGRKAGGAERGERLGAVADRQALWEHILPHIAAS